MEGAFPPTPNSLLFCDEGGRAGLETALGEKLTQAAAAPACSEPCLSHRAAFTVLVRSDVGDIQPPRSHSPTAPVPVIPLKSDWTKPYLQECPG